MAAEKERACWDCPGRTGISRLTGSLACKFFRYNGQPPEWRGGCKGPTPVYIGAPITHVSIDVQENEVITTSKNPRYYMLECPADIPSGSEVPVEIARIMKENHLAVYVDPKVSVTTQDREAYDRRMAEINARIDESLNRSQRVTD